MGAGGTRGRKHHDRAQSAPGSGGTLRARRPDAARYGEEGGRVPRVLLSAVE